MDAHSQASTPGAFPAIIYISTDLKFSQANRTWASFGLALPAQRDSELRAKVAPRSLVPAPPRQLKDMRLPLKWVTPTKASEGHIALDSTAESIEYVIDRAHWPKNVFFLDLASHSAGDDWTLINRMGGFLTEFSGDGQHLMIVDAIEGLEALVGEHDPHGQHRTRRSRIAQLIRIAKRANCHLILIIEEGTPGAKLPEEFMADVVVRLRAITTFGYDRRTIEIEKARGIPHIRGQHDFAIRSRVAAGSLERQPFGERDDPRLEVRRNGRLSPLAYLHTYKSIHARDRASGAVNTPEGNPPKPLFGLSHLDALVVPSCAQPRNSRNGTVTVLIGDTTTYKSRLGRAFLAHAFCDYDSISVRPIRATDFKKRSVLLLSTVPIDRDDLIRRLMSWQGLLLDSRKHLDRQVIVRYITPHFRTSSELIYLLDCNIAAAKKAAQLEKGEPANGIRLNSSTGRSVRVSN